jgi:GNAT superfamily N-acetyltransferase
MLELEHYQLFVHPNYQSQGIGSALIQALEKPEIVTNAGARKIAL